MTQGGLAVANSPQLPETPGSVEPADLRIEIRDRLESLEPLGAQWNDLLASSSADGVFLTWDWIRQWWQIYGAGIGSGLSARADLRVLLAFDRDTLIGIAPLMIRQTRRGVLPGPRVLSMVGQGGGTLAERFAFIVAPAVELEVATAFAQFISGPMCQEWDQLRFERLTEGARSTQVLIDALTAAGLPLESTSAHVAPYSHLPASMDAFLAERSSNFRSQYRRSQRKLEAVGELKVCMAGTDLSVDDAMRALGTLHRKRFDAQESKSFRTEAYIEFHRGIARQFQRAEWLWLAILKLDGKPIAARYDYVYGGKVWCMQGGWDPEYSAFRPGMVLTGRVIEWAISQGCAEYDFLTGDEAYKGRWATGERWLVGVRAFNPTTVRGRLLRRISRARGLLRRQSEGTRIAFGGQARQSNPA